MQMLEASNTMRLCHIARGAETWSISDSIAQSTLGAISVVAKTTILKLAAEILISTKYMKIWPCTK